MVPCACRRTITLLISEMFGAAGVAVAEVDRPNRQTRASLSKSDAIDAYAAARAALTSTRAGRQKSRDGEVEAIRALRVARRGAVKARTRRSTSSRHCC